MATPDSGSDITSSQEAIARRVRTEQVRLAFEFDRFRLAVGLVGLLVAYAALDGVVSGWALYFWISLTLVILVAQAGVSVAYRRSADATSAPDLWEKRLVGGLTASGVAWGLLPLMLMPEHSLVHQMFVIFLVPTITMSRVAALQNSRPAFLGFAVPAIGGLLVELVFLREGGLYDAAALGIGAFTALMYFMFSVLNRTSSRTLLARFENEVLLAEIGQAERTVSAALAEEELMFNTAPVGMMYLDFNGGRRITKCNRMMEDIFGYGRGELVGRSVRVLYPGQEEFDSQGAEILASFGSRGVHDENIAMVRKDGSQVWCRAIGRPVDPANLDRGVIWVFEDLSQKRRAEDERMRSEHRFDLATQASPAGFWDWDIALDRVNYSQRFRELLGYSGDREFRKDFDFRENLHDEDRGRVLESVRRLLDEKVPFEEVLRMRCADGGFRWIQARGRAEWDGQGKAVRFAGAISDFTLVKEREEALSRLRGELDVTRGRMRDAIESVPDAFALFDSEDRLAMCNLRYAERYSEHYRPEDIIGMSFEELVRRSIALGEIIPPEYVGDVEAWIAVRVERHRNANGESFVYRIPGDRWIQTSERGTSEGGIVGVRTDVTALKRAEEQAQHLANHDSLTGLPNRRLLVDRLERYFSQARRDKSLMAVLLVDLDYFKLINDRHGHGAGDDALREIALRLRAAVREVDTVARHGGDEFVVALPQLSRPEDALLVADKIVAEVTRPLEIRGERFQVSASIGISVFPRDGSDAEALIRLADDAMYRMKQDGRSGVRFHSEPKAQP